MLGTFPVHVPPKSLFEVGCAEAAIARRLLQALVRSGATEALPREIASDGYVAIGISAWRSSGAGYLILAYIRRLQIWAGILVIRAE